MDERAARLEWFKTKILPHEGEVCGRLRRLCPAGFDVENLAAESLARAYGAPDFERITSGRAYLFTTARNLLMDALRRETIVSLDLVADLDLMSAGDSLDASLAARDELRRLNAVVAALPVQCRRVFVLRRVLDYAPSEIAARMGLSVSTVEKHLAKAMKLVAMALAEPQDPCLERPARRQAGPPRARRAGLASRR